jgi:hypothetical protein
MRFRQQSIRNTRIKWLICAALWFVILAHGEILKRTASGTVPETYSMSFCPVPCDCRSDVRFLENNSGDSNCLHMAWGKLPA